MYYLLSLVGEITMTSIRNSIEAEPTWNCFMNKLATSSCDKGKIAIMELLFKIQIGSILY